MSENPVPWEDGPRTIDMSNVNIIGLPGGIHSINGDTTPAQTLFPAVIPGGGNTMIITDLGGGSHSFDAFSPFITLGTGPAGIVVNPGVLTPIISIVMPFDGNCFFSATIGSILPIANPIAIHVQIDQNAAIFCMQTSQLNPTANITTIHQALASYAITVALGDVIALSVLQDSIAPVTLNGVLFGMRLAP